MKLHPHPATLLAMLLSMTTGIALGVGASFWRAPERMSELDEFTALVHRIGDQYVEPVAEADLVKNAIRGMMQGLDPHSSFLDEAALADLTQQTTGRFGGIGIEIGMRNGRLTVVTPIDSTPAAEAGIAAGDVLIAADDQPLEDKTVMDAVALLRGPPGSRVRLVVRRKDGGQVVTHDLVRASVNLVSVRGRPLDGGYGYVRISHFQSTTAKELEDKVADLAEQNGGRLAGLVLDLRNNPGGVLQASVAVADAFLDSGLIVYTEGRQPAAHLRFTASRGDILEGAPLGVLINGGSASASEIVAGALQDHERAIVFGTPSYGKGSVQTVLPLEHDRAVKLTTAHYFTPNGRSIQQKGIEPDYVIDVREKASRDFDSDMLLAEALRHLRETPRG